MKISTVVKAQFLLMAPAVLFMVALAGRSLPYGSANYARQVVTWYAGRPWTLWVLLMAMPLTVFAIGCLLLMNRTKMNGERQVGEAASLAVLGTSETSAVILATVSAVGILAMVILHVLAN